VIRLVFDNVLARLRAWWLRPSVQVMSLDWLTEQYLKGKDHG
jgi:hypothetical protein